MGKHSVRYGAITFVLVAAACGGPPRASEPSPDGDPGSPSASPLFAGGEHALPRASAFRAAAGGFRAVARSHEAAIDAHGAQLTPIALGRRGAPLALTTTSLVVGGRDAAADPASLAGAGGRVTIDRGPVREAWTDAADGAEVSWTVAARPAPGPIEIAVAASGLGYLGRTPAGLHFADASGLGFRVGDAIWLDAAGAEHAVPARWDAGAIRFTVPADVVAASAFPATLDPTISPESAVDAPIASTTGANTATPAVAFDGTNYLVVWADARDSRDTDIWGVRVSQAGALLDPAGIQIAATTGVQSAPTVAFDGTRYVVAWQDFKVTGGTEADIAAATVSTAGAVTALPAVATTSASETTPALAGNAGGALLTWVASGQIMGAVWTGGFGAPFAVTSGTDAHKDPAVAANPGGDYLVVFTETTAATSDDARGQLVTAAGALDGASFDVSAGKGLQSTPAAGFDGTNFDVVWSTNNAGVDVWGARVTTAGVVLDTHLEGTATVGGKVLDNAAGSQTAPSLACTAAGCLVSWSDTRNQATTASDVYAALVTTGFAVSGADFAVSNPAFNQAQTRVVATAGGYLDVWQDVRSDNTTTIYGARITAAGAVQDPGGLVLVAGWSEQVGPTSARSGATLAVGWSDSKSDDGNDVDMVRVDATGAPLDAPSIDVSPAALSQFTPASAGMGAQLVYAWTDTRNGVDKDIYAARVAADGTLVDPAGIAITTAAKDQLTPDVASSGAEALVVWSDRGAGTFDIVGAVLGAGGAVTVPPFVICNAAFDQTRPSVTWDAADGQYMVAWVDGRTGGRDIYAARVTAAGAVLDPDGVGVAVGGTRFNPRMTAIGGTILAVYEDRGAGNSDIYGARLTAGASLTVLDPAGIPIATDPSDQLTPVVARTDAGFVVVWNDARDAATSGTDIWAQIVSTGGALVGGNFVVSADLENETTPSAIDASATAVLVSYSKQRTDLDAPRVVTRVVDSTASLVSIAVTPAGPTIAKGQTIGFTATGTYSDGSTQDLTAQVTWASSLTTVATIAPTGVATAVGVGTTTISATQGAISGSAQLTVGAATLLSIDVQPDGASIAKGTSQPYTATGTYTDGSTQDLTTQVTWASSTTSVATISAAGDAFGGGLGTTTISATLGAVSDSTDLTVTSATLVSLDVEPTEPTVAKGTKLQFTATGTYTDDTTQDLTTQVTWSSSVPSTAPISTTGLATALAAGTTTITASRGAISDTSLLTVTNAALVSIAVAPATASIANGTQKQFTATGTYSDGSKADVTTQVAWSSSSAAIATISNAAGTQGLATGKGAGTATITAALSGVSGTAKLTVTAAVLVSIAVTPANASVPVGYKVQMHATATFSDGTKQDVTAQATWASSAGAIAAVSNAAATKGRANVKKVGTATITATFGGKKGTTTLTGKNVTLVAIAVAPASFSLAVKATRQLTATGRFSDNSTLDLTTQVSWNSAQKRIASVSGAGLVTAHKAGTTTIRARKSGLTGTATVTVP